MPQRMVRAGKKSICREEKLSRNRLIEIIENSNRVHLGLTYLTRLFTLFYFYNQAVSPKEHFGRKKGEEKIRLVLEELYAVKSETA